MDAYHALARSYDRLTNDVDYRAIVAFYWKLLERENWNPRSAVDLACGTGSVALLLAGEGMRVTAVDASEEMLTAAEQKARAAGLPVTFVRQRLEQLYLPRGVDLAVCALDSLDYLIEPEDCRAAIRRIYRALNPGGCFLFDVNTPEKLRAMNGQVFWDEDDDVFCIWRGAFDEETNICTYEMELFEREGRLYRRSLEEHREYAYTAEQLTGYLKEAGFCAIEVFADRALLPPRDGEQRIYLKARKGRVK